MKLSALIEFEILNLKLRIFIPLLSILFFIFYFSSSSASFAQTASSNYQNQVPAAQTQNTHPEDDQPLAENSNSYSAPNTNPDVPKNLHTYTQSVMIEVMSALVCQLAGVDPTSPNGKCLGVDTKTGNIGFVENGGGAVGVMGHMISMFYTPPARTVDFIAYAGSNFGITKNAYAQNVGVGLEGLSPLTGLWTKMRDIVYVLFVLVFVVVGVAIMLRVKIDPRTVMTVQNQIPKIIIGLLLVTFSLAIAGFLIDVMYIFIYLIFNIFGMSIPHVYTSPFGVAQDIFGIFNLTFNASYSIGGIVAGLTDAILGSTIGKIISIFGIFFLGPVGVVAGPVGAACSIVGAIPNLSDIPGLGFINKVPLVGSLPLIGGGGPECDIAEVVQDIPGIVLGGVVGMIAFLVILIALIWALFRVWFALLNAYILILVDIIFAPFWIVAGAFPGSSIGFVPWLRSLAANLSVFPAVLVMFIMGRTIMDLFGSSGGKMFVPPLIGNPNAGDHFGAIIGLGFILATPNVVKIMKSAFKAPQIDLSSIGAAIGVGTGVPTRAVSQGAGLYSAAVHDPYSGTDSEKRTARIWQQILRFGR